MKAVKVLIADDHQLMLDAIRRVLDEAEGIEVVGAAHRGTQVLPLVARTNPDVVLLDMRMPQLDGLACLDQIRKRHPQVKVVMLSAFSDSDHIQRAFKRGAAGYIVKSVDPADLPSAIRETHEGTVFHALGVPESDGSSAATAAGLTEREVSILKTVAPGLSNQQVAKELWITEQTVKFHLTNIYRKLGVSNRTEASRWAHEHRLTERTLLHQSD